MIADVKKAWTRFWGYPPLVLYQEDLNALIEYQDRIDRLKLPHPCEGEAGKHNVCFWVHKFTGEREVFSVNTETQEVIKLSFFAKFEGTPELHCDMEIGQY